MFSGVRGDGIYQFDLSLLKNTRLREGLNLEIRGEAYNALEHAAVFGADHHSDQQRLRHRDHAIFNPANDSARGQIYVLTSPLG